MTAASGASAADGGGRGWIEATVADDGYRIGRRRLWRMRWPPRRMSATVAGRPRRIGWLPWWSKAAEAGWPWRTAAPAGDGGDGGGWGRIEAVVADGGNGGGWRRRCGDRAGGRSGCRVDQYIMMWQISTTKFPALARFKIVLLIGRKSPTTEFSNMYILTWESIGYEGQYLFLSLSLLRFVKICKRLFCASF